MQFSSIYIYVTYERKKGKVYKYFIKVESLTLLVLDDLR